MRQQTLKVVLHIMIEIGACNLTYYGPRFSLRNGLHSHSNLPSFLLKAFYTEYYSIHYFLKIHVIVSNAETIENIWSGNT